MRCRRAAIAAALAALASASGCRTAHPPAAHTRPTAPASHPARPAPPPPSAGAAREEASPPAIRGVIHMVRPGQTLYRIARAYGVPPAELMEANGITDPRTLEVGQELLVPGATATVDVDAVAAAGFKRPPEPPRAPPAPAPAAPGPRAELRPSHPVAEHTPRPAASAEPGPEVPTRPATAVAIPHRGALAWPLKGVLYGRFGVRAGARHDGIDVAAPEGTPVLAAADGVAIYVGEQSGYGNVVILRHDDGLVTVYAHASAVLVREGATVSRGDPVARVGQTGRTTGPHLHFEVREGTRPKDPLLFLP